jgi:thiol-disulfide isomerase/thioredoxin
MTARNPWLALLFAVPLVGCPSADNDGDGLTNEEEAELGTDPDEADTDGDGLSDREETIVTTDPLVADTDGDGYSDGDEIADGSNPLNEWSHTYEGGYNFGTRTGTPDATGPTGQGSHNGNVWTAYQNGDIPENFVFTDQYGEEVALYSFYGQHIMLAIGAEWCPPCRDAAARAQEEQDHWGDYGFQLLEVVTQDSNGDPADDATAERWADDFGLETVPSLNAGAWSGAIDGQYWNANAWIPTFVQINEDMEIVSFDQSVDSPAAWLE